MEIEVTPNDEKNPYAPPRYKSTGSAEEIKKKNPWQYFIGVFRKYAVFKGRARRAEYWWFTLFNTIFSVVLTVIDSVFDIHILGNQGLLGTLWSLAVLIPAYSVLARRMHDCNKSGWFVLVPIYNFILCCTEGSDGSNKYGPDSRWEHYQNIDEK